MGCPHAGRVAVSGVGMPTLDRQAVAPPFVSPVFIERGGKMNESTRRCFEDLKSGGRLPSPQGVVLSILDATHRESASVHQIVRLVKLDPAISGRILRYANAANGGSNRHIVSVDRAVTFLGLFRIRQIALAFSLIDQYRSGACSAFDYQGYWTSSLAAGIAAQKLATLAQCPPDESFTCGLLAEVGRLALATAFPEDYSAILQQGHSERDLMSAEMAGFGIDHAQLSAEMLDSWGLPEIFVNAVRHHAQPEESPFSPGTRTHALCSALHFAIQLGQLLNLDETDRWKQVPLLFHSAAQLGMEESDVPPLVESVVADWQAWANDLRLPTKEYSDFRELLKAPPAARVSAGALSSDGPLAVAILVRDPEQRQTLSEQLSAMGVQVGPVGAPESIPGLFGRSPPDVAIVDTGDSRSEAVALLSGLRAMAGSALQIIVLIPPSMEPEVAQLMLAGASDYLLYGFTEAALVARLSTAQRVVSLQAVVRAERELAVSSSGAWARSNRRLLHDALTDPLTQLPNRRYGLDRFDQEWSVAVSNALPIACLMLDIDHFKRVNDERGHDVGDIVLTQVATIIERNCRRSDVVFRYGGEEFCVICPATGEVEAIQLGQRIADAVRVNKFGPRDKLFQITLSVGVALKTKRMTTPNDLIGEADQALYSAKNSGRDRVVSSSHGND